MAISFIRKAPTRRILQGLAFLAGFYMLLKNDDPLIKLIGLITIIVDGILFFRLDI